MEPVHSFLPGAPGQKYLAVLQNYPSQIWLFDLEQKKLGQQPVFKSPPSECATSIHKPDQRFSHQPFVATQGLPADLASGLARLTQILTGHLPADATNPGVCGVWGQGPGADPESGSVCVEVHCRVTQGILLHGHLIPQPQEILGLSSPSQWSV